MATLCKIVVWITAIFHVFFSLKANENPLDVMPLIPGEEITGATFRITDVGAVSASGKTGVIASAVRIKLGKLRKGGRGQGSVCPEGSVVIYQ